MWGAAGAGIELSLLTSQILDLESNPNSKNLRWSTELARPDEDWSQGWTGLDKAENRTNLQPCRQSAICCIMYRVSCVLSGMYVIRMIRCISHVIYLLVISYEGI